MCYSIVLCTHFVEGPGLATTSPLVERKAFSCVMLLVQRIASWLSTYRVLQNLCNKIPPTSLKLLCTAVVQTIVLYTNYSNKERSWVFGLQALLQRFCKTLYKCKVTIYATDKLNQQCCKLAHHHKFQKFITYCHSCQVSQVGRKSRFSMASPADLGHFPSFTGGLIVQEMSLSLCILKLTRQQASSS